MKHDKTLECLLMPAHLVKQEVAKLTIDITSDEALKSLAKTFDVSQTAMAIRLAQLKIF